ncbi:MAG: hypothetical protein Q8Q62_08550 [Mesorhizobium sp.]|nr:hypothetical protein [Mesorhizobium sp.]
MLLLDPASAQATRTWVSGVGDDANPCSRTAPCKTFAGAISKTAAGGEINTIDNGAFGAVTITKSITINGYFNEAGVLASATNGIIVNAGVDDVVVLRGLDIEGAPPGSPGLNGIRFLAGASLHVQDCLIRNFAAAQPNGNGILFVPTVTSKLFVSNSKITRNGYLAEGAASGGAGIQVAPTGSGGAKVMIRDTLLDNNFVGLRTNTQATTGLITVDVIDTSTSGNGLHGIVAFGGTGTTNVMLRRVNSANNASVGLRASAANTTIRVGESVVTGNAVGTEIVGGAQILSYGTNQINGNTNDGPNPPLIPLR